MRIHARVAIITLAVIGLAGAPALAQQQERAVGNPGGHTISGDLIKVDSIAKTITVKASDGVETVLAFNDTTTVTGARDIAGLATMNAQKVDVTYTEDPTTKAKTATKITVQRPAFAPAPVPSPSPAPEPQPAIAALTHSGDLVIVDTTGRTFTVRGADKVEKIFLYTDAVVVTGAKDIAGLATMRNQIVTVTYTEDPVTKKLTATRIVVKPAFSPAPAPAPAPTLPPPAPAVAALTLAGDLVIVDTTGKTLTVRGVDKAETIFLYTDAIAITGAPNIGGLATMTNQKVMVTYTEDPVTKKKTITRIVVSPR